MTVTHTRKQALEDGFLIDPGEIAKEAGIKYPVAITSALWHGYIKPDEESESAGQSTEGRLWDLLCMFMHAARRSSDSLLHFKVVFLLGDIKNKYFLLKFD